MPLTRIPAVKPATRGRRTAAVAAAAALLVVLSGCSQEAPLLQSDDAPVTLTVSDVWTSANNGTGGTSATGGATADVATRLQALQKAIDALRSETGAGWTGRQDDVTGYLTEITGGIWKGTASGFADAWGQALFGIPTSQLTFDAPGAETIAGSSTKATQTLDGVPVLDSSLIFTTQEDYVTGVRGRVFPDLTTSTDPRITPAIAQRTAEELSGGTSDTDPVLVVVPDGAGRLAWSVTVLGSLGGLDDSTQALSSGIYLIDAVTADLIDVRPASAEGVVAFPGAQQFRASGASPLLVRSVAPESGSTKVTGTGPLGNKLTAYGVRVDGGVQLVDTTTPTWNGKNGNGGIYTYDAGGTDQRGKPYVEKSGPAIKDPEAIAAQAYSRAVYDFYTGLGRSSWDGRGAPLISSIHVGKSDFCNAYFTESTSPPQMFYGNPCVLDGEEQLPTFLDIDIAGHEITHGVTASSAALNYSGQSGALNESFSDYFGNIIGNLETGTDSSTLGEMPCEDMTSPTILCSPMPDGGFATRNLLTGNTFDDYLYTIDTGFRLNLLGASQDNGGVHSNSSIWNNALWTIRARLAQIDGVPGNESEAAHTFDQVVYAALTTQLGPTATMVDAAKAVEQSSVRAGVDPTIIRVIREVFQEVDLCTGCADPAEVQGDVVTATGATQVSPAVHGNSVAWVDLSAGNAGLPQVAGVGRSPGKVANSSALAIGFAGDAVVTIDGRGQIVRYVGNKPTTLENNIGLDTVAAGLAGSDDGAAWVSGNSIAYVNAAGKVTRTGLPNFGGSSITALGTGKGYVAFGTDDGQVIGWKPGGNFVQLLDGLPGAVLSVTAYGTNVYAIDTQGTGALVQGDKAIQVSERAIPFGATMNDKYIVWPEAVGQLGGGVADTEGQQAVDTDLYLYSLKTGKVYSVIEQRGQQAFPSISGNRVVWQDSVFGGDDILTATVPSGL